jgi:hypothetical protein
VDEAEKKKLASTPALSLKPVELNSTHIDKFIEHALQVGARLQLSQKRKPNPPSLPVSTAVCNCWGKLTNWPLPTDDSARHSAFAS